MMKERESVLKKVVGGFTLIEMMLVLVIISALVIMGMNYFQQKTLQDRVDKTSLEIQQILTAAMTFYAAKGTWPLGTDGDPTSDNMMECLMGNGATWAAGAYTCDLKLLAKKPIAPWFGPGGVPGSYELAIGGTVDGKTDPKFYAYIGIPNDIYNEGRHSVYAQMIAGKLPLAYTSGDAGKQPPNPGTACIAEAICYAVASVMIPGQNLNNASAINYAGAYRNGGCVPVPQCPLDALGEPMKAQVFLVPVSVSGLYDISGTNGEKKYNFYPITSFTAHIADPEGEPSATPKGCKPDGEKQEKAVCPTEPVTNPPMKYWRACLDIKTQAGSPNEKRPAISPENDNTWAQQVSIAAFTRCSPPGEKDRNGGGLKIYEY